MRTSLIAVAMIAAPPAFASATTVSQEQQSTFDELEKFMDVYQRVKMNYVKSVDDHTLIKGAIDGMLSALDPHSSYAEGSDFDDLQTISEGDYGGLGVVTTVDDGFVKVVSTTEDTPAWRAGIKPNDYITRINGEVVYGLKLDEATDKLRGKPGSKVQITIRRANVLKPIELGLTREVINVKPVKWEVRKGVGIINLNIFNGKAGAETRAAMEAINTATSGGPLGYILDLRSNGGGVLQEAVDIADLFLDRGEIVSQRGRTTDMAEHFYARQGDLAHGRPVIVLVDAGSASASEIVAGALQDHRRALIVGEKSFGKGSVQSIYLMGDRRALRLTTDFYYLPSGRSIQAGGIEPDIVVPQISDEGSQQLAVRESDLRKHLLAEVGSDDALLSQEDPPSPRFSATPASLKRRGVSDFQLHYAINILGRLGPASIADTTGHKPSPPAG